MSLITTPPYCVRCGREITIVKCKSCWQADGSRRATAEQQEINVVGDLVNGYHETVVEQTVQAQQRALIQQVDNWERDAMHKIRQTAEEARALIMKYSSHQICQIGEKISALGDQIRRSCDESDVISRSVSQWRDTLSELAQQLVVSPIITVKETSTPLVTKIVVNILEEPQPIDDDKIFLLPSIVNNGSYAQWIQNGLTVAGGNGGGGELNQFTYPCSLYLNDDQTICVVDYSNHRIVEWKNGATRGRVIAGGNGKGNEDQQLNQPRAVIVDKESDSLIICDSSNKRVVKWPRRNGRKGETIISDIHSYGLTMDHEGYLYVSDYERHEVKRWKLGDADSDVVAGGNGEGSDLNQLRHPMHIAVDQEQTVYVSDADNHRVMKWVKGAREGVVVAGGQGEGNRLTQLAGPRGLAIYQSGAIYVADRGNHRVMCWTEKAIQGRIVVGGNGQGAQPNQFNSCVDLSFDKQGNLFVCDLYNHRVQMFNIDSNSNQQ